MATKKVTKKTTKRKSVKKPEPKKTTKKQNPSENVYSTFGVIILLIILCIILGIGFIFIPKNNDVDVQRYFTDKLKDGVLYTVEVNPKKVNAKEPTPPIPENVEIEIVDNSDNVADNTKTDDQNSQVDENTELKESINIKED